jgi:hypothetical protein
MQTDYFPWEALALHDEDEAQNHGAASGHSDPASAWSGRTF